MLLCLASLLEGIGHDFMIARSPSGFVLLVPPASLINAKERAAAGYSRSACWAAQTFCLPLVRQRGRGGCFAGVLRVWGLYDKQCLHKRNCGRRQGMARTSLATI